MCVYYASCCTRRAPLRLPQDGTELDDSAAQDADKTSRCARNAANEIAALNQSVLVHHPKSMPPRTRNGPPLAATLMTAAALSGPAPGPSTATVTTGADAVKSRASLLIRHRQLMLRREPPLIPDELLHNLAVIDYHHQKTGVNDFQRLSFLSVTLS